VKAYFDKHKERFMVPEQVKISFVTLSANSLITGVQVSDDEIKKFYDENAAKFQGDEQRRASHILIGLGKGDAAAKQAAREQALKILEEVKRSPKQFAELAKKYSQDPGSGQNGGDLGLFGRGAMVKPFEDAVFSMKPGAISDLVESEFGYHIIQLTEIQGSASSLDQVKTEIRAELMYQKALAKFAEQAENFSNMVYEQSGSLDPVVKAFGAAAQTSPLMSRDELMKFFKSEKLVNAIFSDEVLKEKRNSEAIEAAPNTLVSARVLEHKSAAPRSFEEVAPALKDFLKSEKAFALAVKQGGEMLARLKQGQEVSGLEWIPPVTVDRKNAQGLTDDVMTLAFKMDTGKLPAYAGRDKPGAGYTLVRVTKLTSPALEDDAEKKMVSTEVDSALAEEYEAAYLANLRSKAKITVNEPLLNTGSQQ
ncbi:MAG: peptidylprolyl isomerase, partial [Methylobacterium sp.]|nr:peptidylprolyl isomerase [Methylobacterium sp.]